MNSISCIRTRAGAFANVLLLCSLVAAPTHGEDWPMWRHDHDRSAVSSEKIAMPLEHVWTFRSRQADSAPKPANPMGQKHPYLSRYTLPISAADGSLFFTSAIDGRIVSLDAESGSKRWEFLAGCGVNRVPTYFEGKIYAGSQDGFVYCLNAKTGELLWKFKAAPADRWFVSYGRPISVWPVRTDVVVCRDRAFNGGKPVAYFAAGVFPHDGTFLYAIDAESGEVIWRNGTHAESGWRASMAPAGHLLVSEKTIDVPRDFFGYFSGWGTFIRFDRATGASAGYANDAPLVGVRHDNVQHFGTHAISHEPAKGEQPAKQTQLWREDIPGRWVDLDSVLSIRYKRPVYFRWDPELSTVAYAGGVVYYSAFEMDGAKPPGSGIYARNAQSGELLWSTEVPEHANQIIVANGRLFAGTRQGTVHCFAPKGAKKHGVIQESVAKAPFADQPGWSDDAHSILTQAGTKKGYAVVLDCDHGALAYELAKQSDLYVLAVFRDEAKANAARKAYSDGGMHASRIIAFHQPEGGKLPFNTFIADLIVSESAVRGGPLPTNHDEITRLLKPIRGVALLGGKQSEERLNAWSDDKDQWKIVTNGGKAWAHQLRLPLKNAGGWTHAFGDAGNTGCSHDAFLKGPLGVYWYGEPQLDYPAPGGLIVDGVFLLCEGEDLVARDEYTGREMWRRGHGRTDTVCGPGSVLMRYLEVILRIDPATGKELAAFQPPFPDAKDAKWLAMSADKVGKTLYLVAGGKDPDSKDWRAMMAVDIETGNVLWNLGGPGKGTEWGGWNAIGDGFIYLLRGTAEGPQREAAIAELRAYLKANVPKELKEFEDTLQDRDFRVLLTLDAKTGKVLHERAIDLTNCGGKFIPGVGYGGGKYARHYNPNVMPWVMAHKNVVVFGTQSGADKGWSVWPKGAYKQRSLAVYDGSTGKLLWKKQCNYRTRPVIVGDTIYAEPWGYSLWTGERKQRKHPVTGEDTDWAWCRYDKQCGTFSASQNFLFGRSLGVGYHDLLADNGLYTFFHSRMSCSFDAFTGGGMMVKPPNAVSCRCSWSLPFTIALGQVDTPPATPQGYAAPGPVVPVKHLYLDMGANGTRRDHKGNLWIPPTPGSHFLLLRLGDTSEMYEGGASVQRSSLYTPVENTDVPFVFASAVRGLKKATIPVTDPSDGPARFTVRLGFSALPGDQVGQRVFDVKLDGKVVLADFDIMKEIGRADQAIWKEFAVSIKNNLTIELAAKTATPTPEQMPLLNGVVILRD